MQKIIRELLNQLKTGALLFDERNHLVALNNLAKAYFKKEGKPLTHFVFFEKKWFNISPTALKNPPYFLKTLRLGKTSESNYTLLLLKPQTEVTKLFELFPAEEELEQFLVFLLNLLNDGLHIVDKDSKTLFYNKAMTQIEGLLPEDLRDKKLTDLFPGLNHENSTLLSVLKKKRPILDKLQTYTNFKGREITSLNSSLPLLIEGKIAGALEIAHNLTELTRLNTKVMELRAQVNPPARTLNSENHASFTFKDLLGEHPSFQKAVATAQKAARTASPVLIYGETGTGKELIAQSIHNESPRANKPFIAQNCAALPESLLEGLLFGTTKGSFTGAVDRPGLFELAHQGTLLLDEINSMPPNLQAKLLRVLQEGRVRRLGSEKEIVVDVRIIATTNENPLKAIAEGKFREDLFYRLSVVNITLPPLRERASDLPLLVRQFISVFNRQFGLNISGLTPDVWETFYRHHWPGNVRELKHVLEGAFVLADENAEKIALEHLPWYLQNILHQAIEPAFYPGDEVDLEQHLAQIEKRIILTFLEKHQHNLSKTARALGIKRQLLQYKLKKYGLR